MQILNIILIAVGLAMDAFAVAVAVSLKLGLPDKRQFFRLSFHFGFFQFMMPLVGWKMGGWAGQWVVLVDHWVAFGLLVLVGGKMICESRREKTALKSCDPTRGWQLVLLSTATSIDALAVGFSLPFLNASIWQACIIIGIVAALFTVLGMQFGRQIGRRGAGKVEVLGGVILIGIGVKILLEHTLLAG